MKKLIYIITAILISANAFSQVSTCCPEFSLTQMGNIMPCQGDTSCKASPPPNGGNPAGGQFVERMTACKNSVQTYYVFPNLPGFTFTWTVVGGTIASPTGNPGVITWGSGNQGFIQVIISNANGTCKDTIARQVCLLNSPVAAFTTAPSTTVCVNQPVTFTNTSLGASTYSWDFGDGSGSTLMNPPPHLYTSTGVYTVLLTVSNSTGSSAVGADNRCGCTDTASVVINVIAGNPPAITSSCKKMLCPGDTATYCVSPGCAPYTWTVNGGIIINNAGSCITVQWNATPPAIMPASVSVTTGCGGVCGNAATLNVPVLWNNIPIVGPSPVCVGSTTTYSLPTMPGTFYTWTVTGAGGGTIVGPNVNTPTISVLWNGPPGNATITCNYNNPYSGCSGSTTMPVLVRKKFVVNGPSTICAGTPANYNVIGGLADWTISPGVAGTDYTVSGAMTNSAGITITWITAGSYVVTGTPTAATAANYCNPNAIINVVVKPKPVLNNILGLTSVCPGNYYTYTVSSNLAGPFVWTPSSGGTIISPMGANTDSVIIQWTGVGPHSITVSQTINGCTGTKVLTGIINIPAVTISGLNNVCRDQTPHPTYTASGALPTGSYTWAIVPAAAGTITGGQGTNVITVLWHGGATPGTSTANVSVVICNYPPVLYPVTINTPANLTVTKTGSLCTLPGVTLSFSPSLTCTKQWYLNGVAISGANGATYVATTHGYYSVKCPTGCSGFGGIYVPREYIPNVNISANNKLGYCPTEPINLTLFSAAGGGCNYQWFKNGVAVTAISPTNSSLNVTTVGYYYQVVNCGNCKDTSNTITIFNMPCEPDCDLSFNPIPEKTNTGKAGPAPFTNGIEEAPYTATLNIGAPSNLCNNPQFSAIYSLTSPHTLNSGIHWDFGDGGNFSTTPSGGLTPPHTYTAVGVYVVTALINVNCPPPPTPHVCQLRDTIHYTVPVAANFGASVSCDKVFLSNLSTVLSGCSITGYAWSATGPGSISFSSPVAANPVLTVGASGVYNITLTVTSNAACNNCTATITIPVTITLPSATFTAPTLVCAGTPIALTAPAGFFSYLWNFGDTYTSSLQSTTHAFGLTPTNPTISLTVTDNVGCIANFSVPISVIAPPVLTVTPLQLVCPGASATITASTGFATYSFYHNGNLVQSGASNTYTTSAIGTYYVIATTTTGACAVKSVNTYIFNKPNPVADIQGSSVACISGGTAYIYLYNAVNVAGVSYQWNLQGNPTVLSSLYDLNITVNTPGNYSYILTATAANGCVAKDTFCVVVANSPTVAVTTTSPGTMCAGTQHTFNVTTPNAAYIYQWSNGVTGTSMSTSLPGMYMVMATDPANGCMGSAFAGIIQPRPSTILFPVGCDTLCDTDSIIPPLAMGGPFTPGSYTVQWFLNGNYATPIYTGPVLNLLANMPPLIYGVNNISIVVTYNGCSDTSNTYNLFIKNCDSCNCEESSWGDIILVQGEKPVDKAGPMAGISAAQVKSNKANVPQGTKIYCKEVYELKCNQPYTIYPIYNCKDTLCPSKVTYSLQPPTGSPVTGTAPVTFTPTISGTYTLTLYGWCDDKICDSCVITFKVTCDKTCDCKGSKWTDITMSQQNNNTNPVAATGKVANNNTVINPVKINCGKTYDVKCKTSYSVNAGYSCVGNNCPGTVQYVFTGPTGTTSGTMPLNFSLTVTGTYTLSMYGYCGTTKCDSCIVKFKVDCPIDTTCCPYNITVSNPTTTLTTLSSPPATIANSTFNISGPPGNLFTEIRAEVVDYVLTSNFNNECLSCKTYPYAWASMYQPGNVGTMSPQITMYNSTTPSFNPSGAGMYQNPREVIWNSTTPFTLPSSVNLSFLVPAASIIDCCEMTAKICVKFTFRDNNCKECEVVVCYTVIIKPGGGDNNNKECKCSVKPLLKWEGGQKTVSCGETITLFSGNIPVSMQPNFECKDGNGKDCKSVAPTVTIKKPDNSTQVLTGPNYNYTYTLAMPGTFEYTVVGLCNGKKCECKFYVVNPK